MTAHDRAGPDAPAGTTAIDVVIVNWNTGPHLRRCLESLAGSCGVGLGRVVVVDNASTDGSADDLPRELPLVTVRNDTNRGFAAGCNQGAAHGESELLLFLNPDTVVRPDALREAVAALSGDAAARRGICGGSVVRPDGTPALSASRFPTLRNVVADVLRLPRLVDGSSHRHLGPRELGGQRAEGLLQPLRTDIPRGGVLVDLCSVDCHEGELRGHEDPARRDKGERERQEQQ